MNNNFFPHEPDYTPEPALIKKHKRGVNKIYTYPNDKNAKWYKPYPEFKSADQDKYFFKYEYLDAIARNINILQQNLYEEQLREVLSDEMRLNELKAEDRKVAELNNYFQNSLFTSMMTNVKDNYIKAQAELLRRQNTNARGIDDVITDIKTADKETITLQSQNAEIQTELDMIEENIINVVKKLEDSDELDELEDVKDILNNYIEGSKIPKKYDDEDIDDFENETLPEIGSLQKTELNEIINKISTATQTEREEMTEENRYLTERREEQRKEEEKFLRIQQRADELKEVKKDLASKIDVQKNILGKYLKKGKSTGYVGILDKFNKDIKKFNKGIIEQKQDKKDILNLVSIAKDLRYIGDNELDLIKDKVRFKGLTESDKTIMKNNLYDYLKALNEGFKVDLNILLDNLKIEKQVEGLEKIPFKKDITQNKNSRLINIFNDYNKKLLGDLGKKDREIIYNKGLELQKEVETYLNMDLSQLLNVPNPEGQIWEDLPPTTAIQTAIQSGIQTPFTAIEEEDEERYLLETMMPTYDPTTEGGSAPEA